MENSRNSVFYSVGQWCIILLVFLFPLWFLSGTAAPVEFNKALLVSVFVFLAFIFYLADSIKKGNVSIPSNWIFVLIGVMALSWLVSALFAGFSSAIWGGTPSSTSFFDTLTFLFLSLLVFLFFDDTKSIAKLLVAAGLGLALFLLSVLVFSVFGFGPSIGGFFETRSFNTMGSWNSVAFVAAFLIMMIYPFLLTASRKFFLAVVAMFALALFIIITVNFKLHLIILGVFALLFLSHAVWKRNLSPRALVFPLILILTVLTAFVLGDSVTSWFKFSAPTEVSVLPSTTFEIVSGAIRKNVIFGSGPNSFGYLWDEFKPSDVNNTIFWAVRFVTGYSYLLTLFGEIGILAWILFVALLAMVWYWSVRALTYEGNELFDTVSFAAFLLFSYSIVMWSVYAAGYSLAFLGFFSLGISLAVLRIAGILKVRDFQLLSQGPKGFISALILVFLILAGVGGLYASLSRYVGQLAYARGVDAFNRLNNIEESERNLLLALRSDAKNDLYSRTLADLYLVRARFALRERSVSSQLLGSRFKDSLDRAISNAQNAIKNAERDFQNHRSLGKIYELLVGLNADGSLDAAIQQYDRAMLHAPKNPLLWRDKASAYISDFSVNGNGESLKKAEEALLKAVDLKPDYTEAHFLLAQVYDAKGETAEATRRGEAAALLAPNDVGTLFQLGLLYYRSNRFSDAELVFKRAVEINDLYSNARYFLGLIYDRSGRKADAAAEFEKIAGLNPDNEEVKKILKNLKAGRSALETISPPSISPEKRKEPPVKEPNR